MEEKIKSCVLDTNVLLSDPNSIYSCGKSNVVLPLIVIEELDRFKDRQDEVGKNAREIIRKLATLIKENGSETLAKGVSLGEKYGNLQIMSTADLGDVNYSLPKELVERTGDNQIVKFCHMAQAKFGKDSIQLITKDLDLQIKCSALGIQFSDYKQLDIAVDAESLFSGVVTMETSNDLIDEIYEGHVDYVLSETELSTKNIFPNSFVILKGSGKKSLLMRHTEEGKLKKVSDETPSKLKAKNKEQTFALDLLFDPSVKLVTLVGTAGSGKTLLSIAAGLEQTIGKHKRYKNLVVCRPVQPVGKDIGFLPGTMEEKMEPWIAPIKDNLRFLMTEGKRGKNNEDILQYYFDNGIIEVEAMTFIRGRSIANAYMIIDEAQNLNIHELKTILTRAGEGTKIILTGDIEQIDNLYVDSVSNGLAVAVEKFKTQSIGGHVTLTKGERSELATIAAKIL
jgi:PhoH-like ATPase